VEISFLHELHSVEEASGVSFSEMECELLQLKHQLKQLRSTLQLPPLSSSTAPTDQLTPFLSSFYNLSHSTLTGLSTSLTEVRSECEGLIRRYGLHPESVDSSMFFGMWSKFIDEFSRSEEKVEVKRQQMQVSASGGGGGGGDGGRQGVGMGVRNACEVEDAFAAAMRRRRISLECPDGDVAASQLNRNRSNSDSNGPIMEDESGDDDDDWGR